MNEAANGNSLHSLVGLPPVLDACCGGRMMWFDPKDERALYVDKRRESFSLSNQKATFHVNPDVLANFTDLPFPSDTFALVVFDPPHCRREEARGDITRKYGHLNGEWRDMLRRGFAECFRVLRPEGVLVFKWNEQEVPVREILALTPEKPLFGNRCGKQAKTHWIAFLKPNSPTSPASRVLSLRQRRRAGKHRRAGDESPGCAKVRV